MKDENVKNELDNFFREELENLPEEKPDAQDWQQMSHRLQAEGLNGRGSNGRKYLLLLLLLLLLSGLVSIPFLVTDKNENQNVKRGIENPLTKDANKNSANESTARSEGQSSIAESTTTNSENLSANESSSQQLSSDSRISKPLLSRHDNNEAQENSLHKEATGATPMAKEKTDLALGNANDVNNDGSSNSQIKNDAADEQAAATVVQNEALTQAGDGGVKNIQPSDAPGDTALTAVNQLPVDSTSLPDNKTDAPASAIGRFRLGIYASLDYNFYSLKENSNVAQAEAELVRQSDLIKGEKWGGQYTIGITGGYLFTKKLSLEAGVFYSQKKKLHADINTPAYSLNSGDEMFSDFTYDYKARYLELYGRVKYYFHQKKNSLYATLGAAGSYNLPASNSNSDYFLRTSYSEFSGVETERVTFDASSAGLTLVASAGIEIPLGARWDAYVEPTYRHSFYPVIKHPTYNRVPIEHFLRSASLATGLMYKF